MLHILHSSCPLILTITLCLQCSSLKLKLREVTPLTQSHTGTLPELSSGCQPLAGGELHRVKGSWLPLVEKRPQGELRDLPAPPPYQYQSGPWLSGSPTHNAGPYFPRHWCPRFIFRSRVHASFTRRLLAGPEVSVTIDWIASERGSLCLLSVKNTPFRERIQLVFHRERRQPRWKMRTIQIIHLIFTYHQSQVINQVKGHTSWNGLRPHQCASKRDIGWGVLGQEIGVLGPTPSLSTLANSTSPHWWVNQGE